MEAKNNAVFMEPEEYEAYLREQEEKVKQAQEQLKKQIEEHEGIKVSLYEMNQNLIHNMPSLDKSGLKGAEKKFYKWLVNNSAEYYMLLCNQQRYYTVFHNSSSAINEKNYWNELLDVLSYCGDIKLMEEDSGAFSIWATWKNGDTDCLYLFPYDQGVVKI